MSAMAFRMAFTMHVLCILSVSGFLFTEEATGRERGPSTLLEAVRPRPEIPGAPDKSDVIMRAHRRKAEAPEAIRDFHVTWLEWTYSDDPGYISRIQGMGVTFGGASSAGNYKGEKSRDVWNVVDLEGSNVYAPHMRTWDPPNPWGCANHPEFREGHLRFNKNIIDAGADMIQRDEPAQNWAANRWEGGGCYCDYCMEGFNEWLEQNADPGVLERTGAAGPENFDYRRYLRENEAPEGEDSRKLKDYFEQFQIDSTIEFHRWWRRKLNEHAGRHVPVTCNNGGYRHGEIEQVFDYWIGELRARHASPASIYDMAKRAHDYGKTQSVTMPLQEFGPLLEMTPERIQHIRQTMAATYAAGIHMEMPWDTFLRTPDADRFFGDPEDFADLTAFVHAMSRYLDRYSDAAAAGGQINDERWPSDALPVDPSGDSVYAFARVNPDREDAPVVVHLMDWREEPGDFRLNIRPEAFFGDRPLKLRLFTPVPYDREAHGRAFDKGDYSGMAREIPLESGFVTSAEIPALAPWGILVVEPMEESKAGPALWQPALTIPEDDLYNTQQVRVHISSLTEGAQIRYTTDGSEPGVEDNTYTEPVIIEDNTLLRAKAFFEGAESASASLDIRRKMPEAIPPHVPRLFDGKDDAVIIHDDDEHYRLTAYTYSMWIKVLEGPTGSWRQVFTKGKGTPDSTERAPGVWLRDDSLRFHFTHSTGQTRMGTDSSELSAGQWVHAAFVATGADGEMKIFLNGEQDVSTSVSGLTSKTQDAILWIGNGPDHAGINARISDFRIHDRALTAECIRDLYAGKDAEEGLVGWWSLRDISGRTVEDLARAQDGVFEGAPRRWKVAF